ncbi:hypothetical protein [Methylobacterium nonmethylotrophicum]|uniref:Uncharacterized protein n=1 Tax=Methylobacterium nonmethylotrophicum TaxID=1141884 RepID=A0A4Z0NGD1_9HYPH|nr:hypothetical protein [Methylobacterium nonmethylotrophicum]TGD95270.1 hypothetical protein EU555_28845 [Methylobacterium nonmethylotrophicum]
MPLHQTTPAARLRALLLAMTSGCLLIASSAGARAENDGLDFLRQMFSGPAAAPAPTAQPYAVQPYDAPMRQRVTRRKSLATQARALRGRTRYVALPKPEVKPQKATEVKPLAIAVSPLKSLDARTALLRDPTLRPGDIVIMPEGPRVFQGTPDSDKHKMADFHDVNRPGVVPAKTRKELLAMTAPIGALPADAARRMMAQYQKASATVVPTPRVEAALARVVYPR